MLPNESIGFLINRTGRKLAQCLSGVFQPYDLTPEQWGALNSIGVHNGISQKDLAAYVEKDQTNVTRILDQLERKKLIRRVPNSGDRRSFLAFLTEDGSQTIETLTPLYEQYLERAVKNIPEEKLAEFKQTLNLIRANLD